MLDSLPGQVAKLRQRRTAPLILELDLTEGIAEERPADPVSAVLARRRPVLADVLDGLRRAAADPRVTALVAKVGGRPIGLAVVQELRAAVTALREAGKQTVAWAETFGEFSAGNVPYYLATAFGTDLPAAVRGPGPDRHRGRAAVLPRRAGQARRGVPGRQAARVQERRRPAHRARLHRPGPGGHRAAGGLGRWSRSPARSRPRCRITGEEARALIDRGPFLAAEALEAGLVDALGYRDEVYAEVRKEAGPDAYAALPGPLPAGPQRWPSGPASCPRCAEHARSR